MIPPIETFGDFTYYFFVLLFFIIVRYFLIAGSFYSYFYIFRNPLHLQRKLSGKIPDRSQIKKEMQWAFYTSLIFSATGTVCIYLWHQDKTSIYTDVAEFGWIYLILSLPLLMLLHETYYYWIHRVMHLKSIYKIVHKVHHNSIVTSPWTAFSFHPLESLLQAIIFPAMIMLIPVHLSILILFLTIMTVSSVINHLDIELYPDGFSNHWFGKWLIGATHHSLHHSHFKVNFGLYFTFWDKISGTESPLFSKLFKEKTSTGNSFRKVHKL